MLQPKSVTQYLARHAEPVVASLAAMALTTAPGWYQAVVIPAFREGDEFIRRLLAVPLPCSTLFIVVLNGPAEMSDADRVATLQAQACLQVHCEATWQDSEAGLQLFQTGEHAFLCVNLLAPFNAGSIGVGHARKTGTDIALALFVDNLLQSPWVRSTDADVHWPDDYFSPLTAAPDTSAILYPFRHQAVQADDKACCEAAAIYDSWLRYYVAGLRWSGSPWAFHTIGSTLAIHLQHYAMQRGFPNKEAGEDFYLLNKLAKSGRIQRLQYPVLALSNRVSDRTPFGTGVAIGKISQADADTWPFYAVEIFAELKCWHDWLPRLHALSSLPDALRSQPVFPILQAQGLDTILAHCRRQCATPAAFTRHLWLWFDAAMTRKCVHALRDAGFGSIGVGQLLQRVNQSGVPFLPGDPPLTQPWQLSAQLQLLEQTGPESP